MYNNQLVSTHSNDLMIRNLQEYYPQQLGVRYDPPAIIIQYLLAEQQKTMHHKILVPVLNLQSQIIASMIRKQHPDYFYKDRVSESNIRKLIEKLKRGKDYQKKKRQENVESKPFVHEGKKGDESKRLSDREIMPDESMGQKQIPQFGNGGVEDKQKSLASDNYYGEQFQDFEASQQSKSQQQSFYEAEKPKDSPFEFLDEDPLPPPVPSKQEKPPLPPSKSKPSSKPQKAPSKPQPKPAQKQMPPPPVIVQQIVDDCFQFLQ